MKRCAEASVAHRVTFGLEICGEAVDGLDAVEKAKSARPDVIILDISMPKMSGLQAAPLIKKE
jgi:YesN/AraC family two-component response regulator